jgi:DNA-binding NarL/FixJ family response regulator
MPSTRLLLIDDHALFRLGIQLVLKEGIAGAEVLEADTLVQAMHVCEEPPALVLLDIQLQGVNGLEGLGLLQSRWPGVPVIMLSSLSEPDTVRLALARGAAAFVSKAEPTHQILQTIRKILSNDSHTESTAASSARSPNTPLKSRLTPRQCEVLDLISEGLPNKAIARRLDLSEFTVRGHVQALFGLLQVSSRAQATVVARRSGLIG